MAVPAALPSQPQQRRRGGSVAAVLSTGLAVATVVASARQDRTVSVEHNVSTSVQLIGLASGLAITGSVWAIRTQHPHVAIGLAATAASQLLPVWAGWPALPGGLRAGVLATAPLAVGGTAQVALGWNRPRRRSGAQHAVWLLAASAGMVLVVGYNPFADRSCIRTCEAIAPVAQGVLSTHAAVVISALLAIAATVVATAALWRSRRLPGPPAPIVAATSAALAMLAYLAIVPWTRWGEPPSGEVELVLLPSCVLAVLGVAVLAVAARTTRTRIAVDRLVTRLSEPESALRDLGGAIRAVHFAVPEDGRWVDPAGHYVPDTPVDGPCVEMADDAGPVLRLLVARADETVDSLAGLSPATRLSLRNAQLAAVAKARLDDVQASRRRVVATSDAERQRIERDLHDGAQQRLVSAAFYLSVARRRLPVDDELLARAETSLSAALSNLRAISHGIFPSALATEGLPAALEDLIGLSEVPARLELHDVDDGVAAETAMAAYATVAAALESARASSATEARISVEHRDCLLTVCVETDISTGAAGSVTFGDVTDRVGAVGGQFSTSATEGVARVMAVFPCAS